MHDDLFERYAATAADAVFGPEHDEPAVTNCDECGTWTVVGAPCNNCADVDLMRELREEHALYSGYAPEDLVGPLDES